MAVDPEVAKLFSRHLRIWREALRRWTDKCKSVQEEYKKSRSRRHLVADRMRSAPSKFDPGAKLSDAMPLPVTGTRNADDEAATEKRAKRCDEMLEHIRNTIANLNHARTTGEFPSLVQKKIALRKQPKFITPIDRKHEIERGDRVEVTRLQGEWLWVKTANAEGWLHRTYLLPKTPVDLTSESGLAGHGKVDEHEVETGVRDTVGGF